jgi:hypothetical protein
MDRVPLRSLVVASLVVVALTVGAAPAQARPKCAVVSASTLGAIAARVTTIEDDKIVPVTIAKSAAVRSADYKRLYFVSANLRGPTRTQLGIATFATNRINGVPQVIFAIDPVADAHSDWTIGSSSSAHVSMSDQGARASRKCVK